MKVYVRKLFISFIFVLGTAGAVAQTENAASQSSIESVREPLGEYYKLGSFVVSPLARIVVYRTSQGYVPDVVRVEVNGRYHSSLQLGSFTEICLPASDGVTLSSRLLRPESGGNNVAETTALNLKPGRDTYVRVVEMGNGRVIFTQVAATIAMSDLQQTRRQIHAVSRAVSLRACDPDVSRSYQSSSQ
jgi:OmpA-OmpF porin, OOP family